MLFHNTHHPNVMWKQEIEAYLNHLVNIRSVFASTQSGVLNAIAFLYRAVLKMDMPCLVILRRIKRRQTMSIVMSVREIQATSARMSGAMRLMAEFIYGTGMQIGEYVTLRVKDIVLYNRTITVWTGKGNRDCITSMPETLIPNLRDNPTKVAQLHTSDVPQSNGFSPVPNALYKKYPSAFQSLGWPFVFPSKVLRP